LKERILFAVTPYLKTEFPLSMAIVLKRDIDCRSKVKTPEAENSSNVFSTFRNTDPVHVDTTCCSLRDIVF
jgi:hypothetical protein